MDTPTGSGRSSGRPTRIATPRRSERKRQLFRSRVSLLDQIEDDSDVEDSMLGLTPLKPRHQRENCVANKQQQINVRKLFPTTQDTIVIIDSSSSVNSSPETNKENKRSQRTTRGSSTIACTDEQLPHLFTANMCINSSISPRSSKSRVDINTDSDGDRKATESELRTSRAATTSESSPGTDSTSPESKLRKLEKECIPTGAFYSNVKSRAALRIAQGKTTSSRLQGTGNGRSASRRSKNISPNSRKTPGINKGVMHKIKKRPRPVPTVLDDILGTLRNEKLRELITTKREERARVEHVHEILRRAKDPIKMAKPLSAISEGDANNNNNNNNNLSALDFSDFTDDEELNEASSSIETEPVIPLIRPVDIPPPLTTSPKSSEVASLSKRKFFKSGRRSSTCMEVRITDHIRASVNQGKIMLVEAPPVKKQRRVHVRSATIFSAEQATVDAILRNLDDTVVDEIVESSSAAAAVTLVPEEPELLIEETIPIQDPANDPYFKYRSQLPYKTSDAATMEQQALLLEFLISNNICTDKNFEIFIADPDNHKDEATRIVDQLYMVINAEMQELDQPAASVETTAQPKYTETEPGAQQKTTEGEMETESVESTAIIEPSGKLFPIFTQRLQPLPQKSTRRKFNASATRLTAAASGAGQYQIDAGQKAFGARQCQQCGLVYTVHEPEEEQLHREYHNAVHVLRFKGWIDEDIVAVYPEWGADGRIIRITEQAPAARLQRLCELVKVVDKELGFASYIVPKTFVAFFAVRKQQIVGLCLVQPLEKANRFIQVDGVDYFSEETFDSSCGISRIWVSPLHRRRRIASLLLQAVQLHTVRGCEISRDKIAFSTPTDDGRALARHFTQNNNFLAYDQ
ncbi:N-acetyltransferase eco [Drosophila albomicans]|uniref:N-acetyltransferase eco n=1 Tax=Drosophila albomicans TaxID=7291 RepID=A0A6P8X876_DROAB|nr:N-acetyltransferase eco [Drosophila albomicans]